MRRQDEAAHGECRTKSRTLTPRAPLAEDGEPGVLRHEVERAVRGGTRVAAKQGRQGYRRDFPFVATWGGKHYTTKRVLVIVAEDEQRNLVITVYSFYF